jgi:antitoxin component of MazEF toxin-antitoxin module
LQFDTRSIQLRAPRHDDSEPRLRSRAGNESDGKKVRQQVREEKGRIVIGPVRQKTYVLDDLLKGIASKNLHKAVDFGSPQGKEVWRTSKRYVSDAGELD